MASNSEKGHAINLANFKLIIDRATGFGATYNPSNSSLTVVKMKGQLSAANTAQGNLISSNKATKEPINERELLFEPLDPLVTRVINYASSTNASKKLIADAKGNADKIRGASKKKPGKKTDSSDPLPEDGVSTSQQSYVQRTDAFQQLIELLKTVTDYSPNETDLTTASLDAYLTDLKTANDSLGSLLTTAANKLIARNKLLYESETGIIDTALKCKKYIKGLYGAKSAEYGLVSGIKFSRAK
ncbi:MAG TPA: hypothetical protein PLP23_00355 [Panacibacter sp.]|nr:hypothetical protein [Panacibacter sp.]